MDNLISTSPAQAVVLKLMSCGSADDTDAALLTLGMHKGNMTEVIIPSYMLSSMKHDNYAQVNNNLYFSKDDEGNYIFIRLSHTLGPYVMARVGKLDKETEVVSFPASLKDLLNVSMRYVSISDFISSIDWDKNDQMFTVETSELMFKGRQTLSSEHNLEDIICFTNKYNVSFRGAVFQICLRKYYTTYNSLELYSDKLKMNTIIDKNRSSAALPSDLDMELIADLILECVKRYIITTEKSVHFEEVSSYSELICKLRSLIEDHEKHLKEKKDKEEQEENERKAAQLKRIQEVEQRVKEEMREREPKQAENPDNHNRFYNGIALGALFIAALAMMTRCGG